MYLPAMNHPKTYIRLKNPDAGHLSKHLSSTRYHALNESLATVKQNEDKSARTFLHLESRATKNLTRAQGSKNLISSFPCLNRTVDGQGRKFSSTTIVNGSASSLRQVHPSCIDDRVVVLPVETIVPDDDVTSRVGIFMDPVDIKKEETFTLTEDLPENCYFTVQEECAMEYTLEPNPYPKKITRTSQQKLLLPAAGNGKRGLIRFGRSRMVADTHTSIPVAEYKAQLKDTMDIIGEMELAPPTKRMMFLLNTKGVNKLFAIPGRKMGSKTTDLFVRHLTLKQTPAEMTYDDMPLLPVGFVPEIDKSKIKRITRKRRYPEAEEYQRNLYKSQLEYLNSIHADAGGPERCCKVSIFMDTDEIISDDKDNVVPLGSMEAMVMQEEEVLADTDIFYQEDLRDDDAVLEGSREACEEHKSTILVNDKAGTNENIEEVLAEAEKRGIKRDEIQKVVIYQQGQLDGKINASTSPSPSPSPSLFANNGKFIIMSCDPSESEIVVSS